MRTLRVAHLDVAFISVFVSAFGGSFLVGCVKNFNGGDFWVGLVSAIGAFAGVANIPGAIFGRSFGGFKKFVGTGGWIWRLLYLVVAILPVAPMESSIKLWVLILCIGVASISVNLVGAIYTDWLGRLVPERSRGWFFSQRTLITTAVSGVAGVVLGMIMDHFRQIGQEAQGYTVVFSIAWIAGMISMYYFMQMTDLKREDVVKADFAQALRQIRNPLRDQNVRRLLLFTGIFTASQTFAGNFFAAYALETLKMDFVTLNLLGVMHAIGTVATVKAWGFLADKYGNKPVLSISGFLAVFTPMVWLFCREGQPDFNRLILLTFHIFNGFVWAGVAVSQGNLNMAVGKTEDRANTLALITATAAICGGVAPFISSIVLSQLRLTLTSSNAYHAIFVMAILIRVSAVLSLIPIVEAGATSLRATLRQLRTIKPSGVVALRAVQSSGSDIEKADAIERVGAVNFTLATDELGIALSDPSPRVRRTAALALGRLGTQDAAAALVRFIESHPNQVEDEMLEALGDAPSQRAVPMLIQFLDHPQTLLRRAAAKALGRIGDPSAVDALCVAASRTGDGDLRRAALQALREMGVTNDAIDVYRNALADPSISIQAAAAEAVSELEIESLAEDVRQSLLQPKREPVAEAVYALGCVGEITDIPLMLQCAQETQNRPTRRRCLLGIARLLGVEQDVYRLMMHEGMARDSALFSFLKTAMRRSTEVSGAVERYSAGDEPGAITILANARPQSVFQSIADRPVEESFLVAIVAFARINEE